MHFDKRYNHIAIGSTGDVVDYQIISTQPIITSQASSLSTYTFVDSLSKGIEYNKNDVKIEWFKDAACTPANMVATWTEADNRFAVAYRTASDDATTMTVAGSNMVVPFVKLLSSPVAASSLFSLVRFSLTHVRGSG